MIKIKLKDNSIIEVEKGTSIINVEQKISEGLARVATCGIVNGEVTYTYRKIIPGMLLNNEIFSGLFHT